MDLIAEKERYGTLSVSRGVVHQKDKGVTNNEGGRTLIQLNYRDAKPIYEQVKEGIKQMVYNEVLSPDEKLPSVREMASKLAINPNTISRAYKDLETEGFLYTQTGIGTFVNKDIKFMDRKTQELYERFDEVTKQLFYFSITPDELCDRVQGLAKGGCFHDSSK